MAEQVMQCDAFKLMRLIKANILMGLNVLMYGPPGAGKTEIGIQAISELQREARVRITATMDSTDAGGIPDMSAKDGRIDWSLPRWLPLDGDPLPQLVVMYLDEYANGQQGVRNSLQKLINEKEINGRKLAPGTVFLAATNRAEHRAGANKISTAEGSRFVQLHFEPTAAGFVEHAENKGFHPAVIATIKKVPALVNTFAPDKECFSCPRQLERVSDTFKSGLVDYQDLREQVAGLVGYGAMIELMCMYEFTRLVDLADIVADPHHTSIPANASEQYAVTSMLATYMTKQNADPIVQYLARMDACFKTLALKLATKRDPELDNVRSVTLAKV